MAGAAEAPDVRRVALAGPPATAIHTGAWRARLGAWRPTSIALTLVSGAAAAHFAVWGAAAPLGRAEAAGSALAALGLAWLLWAVALFRVAGTPIGPGAQALQLIEEGPYRFGRHPMYLGFTVMLTGAALGLGMPLLALSALLFASIVGTVHVPQEEARLNRRFGGWYRDYAGSTRRWM